MLTSKLIDTLTKPLFSTLSDVDTVDEIPENVRLLENGDIRILENGDFRIHE